MGNVAYVGDDINDLEVIRNVGFGCSVANGVEKVKSAARYVTSRAGGQGAVREVAELLLEQKSKLKGKRMDQLDKNIYSVRELRKWLQEEEKVVIYGIGDYGKQIVNYLFFIGEEKKIEGIVVTEKGNKENYRGIEVQESDDFFRNTRNSR